MSKNEKPVAPLDAKVEIKTVKHTFLETERNGLNLDLLGQLETVEQLEFELKQVKSSFKAKIDEADSRIINLRTSLRNGFEMRPIKCWCICRPKDGEKDWYREDTGDLALTEKMTQDDFQQDLIRAEAAFDRREEIELFPPTPTDFGVLVVGRMNDRWHSALRVKIGNRKLEERLDSEQKSVKLRFDAIKIAVKRLNVWAGEQLGKEAAKGFADPINAAVEAQKERVE
jgi:hypothetical protein